MSIATEHPDRGQSRLRSSLAWWSTTASRYRIALIIVALAACPGLRLGPAPVSTILIVLTAPLWLPALLRLRAATALAAALLLLGASGIVIHAFSAASVDNGVMLSVVGMTLTAALLVGLFTWAAASHGWAAVAVAFGVGALVNVPLAHLPLDENGWKYFLAYPTVLILLGLFAGRNVWFSVGALALVSVVSAVGGYRSMIAICAGAIVLSLIAAILRRHPLSIRGFDTRPVIFLVTTAAVAVAGVFGFTQLLVSGLLGSRVRESTELALSRGGDIITGGRVEWIATRALFTDRPWGPGPGYVPSERDRQLILDAYSRADVEPSLQHLRQYVFDDRFKLHAIYADFWVNFGPVATLLFVGVAVFIVARFVILGSTSMSAPLLLWFVVVMTAWDLAFSPIYTNLTAVLLSLTLLASFTASRKPAVAGAT